MADLLIKGMEMPQSCKKCEWLMDCESSEGWEVVCVLQGSYGYRRDLPKDRRDESCPLVEVPAHGRLIDGSELLATITECAYTIGLQYDGVVYGMTLEDIARIVLDAPTVLEASDSNALNALDALEVENG